MNFVIPGLVCLPPPQAVQLCITIPGGVKICANDVLNAADPFMILQSLFAAFNASIAPLQPTFDIIGAVEALVNCIQAIPQCLEPPVPNPKPLLECIPKLAQALAKLLGLLPALSVPIMVLEFIKALIVAISAFITRLEFMVVRNARLLAAALKAADPGNVALKAVVDCARGNMNVELMNLNAAMTPLNELLGIVNLFGSLVPGLPQPLIPDLAHLGADAAAALQPLTDVVTVLNEIVSFIPVP